MPVGAGVAAAIIGILAIALLLCGWGVVISTSEWLKDRRARLEAK